MTRLHLHGFDRQDRLEIVRRLRDLIPAGKQDGWPLFCSKVALPLRDGVGLVTDGHAAMDIADWPGADHAPPI